MRKLTVLLLITSALGLFDEEFEALKQRITALEAAAEEDKGKKILQEKDITDLKIKVSNLVYKDNNENSLTEVTFLPCT